MTKAREALDRVEAASAFLVELDDTMHANATVLFEGAVDRLFANPDLDEDLTNSLIDHWCQLDYVSQAAGDSWTDMNQMFEHKEVEGVISWKMTNRYYSFPTRRWGTSDWQWDVVNPEHDMLHNDDGFAYGRPLIASIYEEFVHEDEESVERTVERQTVLGSRWIVRPAGEGRFDDDGEER